jgi:hypothetical protein
MGEREFRIARSREEQGLVAPRYARLGVTTIWKHKHPLIVGCLCFQIVVTLITPALSEVDGPACDQPAA